RLNTTRVRPLALIRLRLRSAESSIARCEVPRLLPVSRKSSAMRGGLAMANPAGGLAGGAFSVNLTIVRPDVPLDTATLSMLFDCAAAAGENASAAAASIAAMSAAL